MHRHRVVLLIAGIVLIAVVAVPERRPQDLGRHLPRLDHAARLSGFLRSMEARDAVFTGDRVELAKVLAEDPARGVEVLEARLGGLWFGGDPLLPRIDAAIGLWWPHRSLLPEPLPVGPAVLPLRAPTRLGDRGLDLLRVSSENAAAFPEDVRGAVAELVAAVRAVAAAGLPDEEAAAYGLRTVAAAIDRAVPVLRAANERGVFDDRPSLPDGGGLPRGLLLVSETDAGLVVIGGPAATVLPMEGVALAIDVGGDDRWLAGVAMGPDPAAAVPPPLVRVVVDLAGRDRYIGDGRTFAGADAGISVLLDEGGDDTYESEAPAFATTTRGAALLVDRAGRDRYLAASGGLGLARGGFALLLDDGGDDRFESGGAGLGAGEQAGFGALLDAWGNDVYLALGALPDPGERSMLALGAARTGGLGLVVDRAGRDVYRAASGAGGFATSGGVAIFVDAGGDDMLSFGSDALGSASQGGFALCRDLQGDDRILSRARSQGFADAGLALYVDDGGDDDRLSWRPSVGVGEHGGTAVFVDLEGR